MADAKRDNNRIPTIIGVSSIDLVTPTRIAVNPVTGAVLIDSTSLTTGLNAIYLRLDTSNSPLIGTLVIADNAIATKAYRLRTSGSALDFDAGGQPLVFSGYPNADFSGTQLYYLTLGTASHFVATHGQWVFRQGNGGTTAGNEILKIEGPNSSGAMLVFNDDGAVYSARFESDNDQNNLYLDSVNDRIGIGLNNPAEKLDILGNLKVSGTISSGAASGTTGTLKLIGSTSGTASIVAPAAAGTPTLTAPVNSGTLAIVVKTGLAKISGGAMQFGLPGAVFISTGTTTLTINEVRYLPFLVPYPVTITAQQFEVTTGPVGAANVRVGIYAADTDMQPTGAPAYDSGSVAVANGFTGVKTTSSLSVALTPGMYLVAINCDVAMVLRTLIPGAFSVGTAMGATPFIQRYGVAQTYGAFPNPGTKWTTPNATAGGLQHSAAFQWTE